MCFIGWCILSLFRGCLTILVVYVERGVCEVIGVVVVDVIGIAVCVDVFSLEKNVVCVVSGDACVVFQFPLDSVVRRRSSTRNTKKTHYLNSTTIS